MPKKKLSKFERDLLESVRQAEAGEVAAAHTPDAIAFKLMLDDDSGLSRQALADALRPGAEPTFEAILRVSRGLGLHLRPPIA